MSHGPLSSFWFHQIKKTQSDLVIRNFQKFWVVICPWSIPPSPFPKCGGFLPPSFNLSALPQFPSSPDKRPRGWRAAAYRSSRFAASASCPLREQTGPDRTPDKKKFYSRSGNLYLKIQRPLMDVKKRVSHLHKRDSEPARVRMQFLDPCSLAYT